MVATKFKLSTPTEEIDLYVIEDFGFGGEQSVVIYESAGGNGGAVLLTGRKNKQVTLTGRIISKETDEESITTDLNEKSEKLEKIRDDGTVVKLTTPITRNDSGKYVIRNFTANLVSGQLRAINFTMTLDEYRQKGVKQSSINLVNFRSGELLKQLYNIRRQGG